MCIHMATPRSGGLFRGVIMESGLCGVWDWNTGIAASAKVVVNAGCSGIFLSVALVDNINNK